MIPAEIVSRRDVIELAIQVAGRPLLRSAGHGDVFSPHLVTLRFAGEQSPTPGALLMPVTVVGPAAAAQAPGPYSRHRTFRTAGELPPWVLEVAEWAKTQPRALPSMRNRVAGRATGPRVHTSPTTS